MNKTSTLDDTEIVVGLDIGTTKIATVIGYCDNDGKICVLGHGKCNSNGVEYGAIRNINKAVAAINSSKEIAMQRAQQEISHVYSGIAGRHIKSREYRHVLYRRNGKDEIIQQSEIDQMNEDVEHVSVDPGEKIISVIPQRYVIDEDHETNEPVGELGETIAGYYQIITGDETEIKKIIRCVNTAELAIDEIILEPIASGLACLTPEDKQYGVALVDIGGGTTDISIFVNNHPVFSQVISIGGNIITKDIATICKIPEELAEQLKVMHGSCIENGRTDTLVTIPQFRGQDPIQISQTYLSQIIKSRAVEILNLVQKEINLSGYSDKLMNGIVLTGGGANLSHLKELCQYTTHLPTRIGIPNIGFSNSMHAELKHPMFATALGLLKYGLMANNAQRISNEVATNTSSNGKESKSNGGKKGLNLFNRIQQYFNTILEKTS